MRSTIIGNVLPVLELELAPGERIIAETGQLSWMSGDIALHTTTATAGASGFFGALTRAVGGGGLFMTEYSAQYSPGLVAFAAKVPGHILPIEIQPGSGYLVHRHGFLCATPGVNVSIGIQQSLGAGIFGGNGFVMQRLDGTGHGFVELGGEIIERTLAPGEVLRVHPGHVGMIEQSVNFGITTISGVRNMIFGGDGIFLAELTGPGKIWLQTLTLPDLAHALSPYLSGQQNSGALETTAELGVAGALLKGFLSR